MHSFQTSWWFKLHVSAFMASTLGDPIFWTGGWLVFTYPLSGWTRECSGRDHRLQSVENRGCWCWPLQFFNLFFRVATDCHLCGWVPLQAARPVPPASQTPEAISSRFSFASTVWQSCCAGNHILDLLFLIVIPWAHLYKAAHVCSFCFQNMRSLSDPQPDILFDSIM